MNDEARVQQLVDHILGERTPEAVCADCPELLEAAATKATPRWPPSPARTQS
jgi:hypothetical protein